MDHLDRFLAVMECQPVDRVPNWELGVWPRTRVRWEREEPTTRCFHWDWFAGESQLSMDPREFVRFDSAMIPPFEAVVPMMMDAGVDVLWPLERAADQDPVRLRRKSGRTLRLWGGVDKRVLA